MPKSLAAALVDMTNLAPWESRGQPSASHHEEGFKDFELVDELYMMNRDGHPDGAAKIRVLAESSVSVKSSDRHPVVWVTEHPKTRIVGITLGHDERAHGHPDYQKILANAAKWVARNRKAQS